MVSKQRLDSMDDDAFVDKLMGYRFGVPGSPQGTSNNPSPLPPALSRSTTEDEEKKSSLSLSADFGRKKSSVYSDFRFGVPPRSPKHKLSAISASSSRVASAESGQNVDPPGQSELPTNDIPERDDASQDEGEDGQSEVEPPPSRWKLTGNVLKLLYRLARKTDDPAPLASRRSALSGISKRPRPKNRSRPKRSTEIDPSALPAGLVQFPIPRSEPVLLTNPLSPSKSNNPRNSLNRLLASQDNLDGSNLTSPRLSATSSSTLTPMLGSTVALSHHTVLGSSDTSCSASSPHTTRLKGLVIQLPPQPMTEELTDITHSASSDSIDADCCPPDPPPIPLVQGLNPARAIALATLGSGITLKEFSHGTFLRRNTLAASSSAFNAATTAAFGLVEPPPKQLGMFGFLKQPTWRGSNKKGVGKFKGMGPHAPTPR